MALTFFTRSSAESDVADVEDSVRPTDDTLELHVMFESAVELPELTGDVT